MKGSYVFFVIYLVVIILLWLWVGYEVQSINTTINNEINELNRLLY
jgi:hypothetical protein